MSGATQDNGTSAPRLPREVLFDLLPAAFEPWGSSGCWPSSPPSPASIARIQNEAGITLPQLMVHMATACPAYGGWFGSIGDDYDSHNHLLVINREFHARGLPTRYVMLNHGHDGACDAWDLHGPATDDERPIVCFNFDGDRCGSPLTGLKPHAASFADYLDRLVRAQAPRCPQKNLRRRAKRLLAIHSA